MLQHACWPMMATSFEDAQDMVRVSELEAELAGLRQELEAAKAELEAKRDQVVHARKCVCVCTHTCARVSAHMRVHKDGV